MTCIGSKHFAVAFGMGYKQAGIFKTVKFEADRIGRFTELALQSAQMGSSIAVEKEFQQQLDAGFGSNETFEHAGFENE
jgi:hypothetical protein